MYAGSAGNSASQSPTPAAGQVVDGDLRITVPENMVSDERRMITLLAVSGGTPTYGGDLTDAQRADDDPVDNDDLTDGAVG